MNSERVLVKLNSGYIDRYKVEVADIIARKGKGKVYLLEEPREINIPIAENNTNNNEESGDE
jgi:hypothetical protein